MNDREKAVTCLRGFLNELTHNDKKQIQVISWAADDYSVYKEYVVKEIVAFIRNQPPENKVVSLFIMDSIIKNSEVKTEYQRLFGNELPELFLHCFKQVPIVDRRRLYKTRVTWHGVFAPDILLKLDTLVKQVDPTWPISGDHITVHHAAVPPPAAANNHHAPRPAVPQTSAPVPVPVHVPAPRLPPATVPSAPNANNTSNQENDPRTSTAPVVSVPAAQLPTTEPAVSAVKAQKKKNRALRDPRIAMAAATAPNTVPAAPRPQPTPAAPLPKVKVEPAAPVTNIVQPDKAMLPSAISAAPSVVVPSGDPSVGLKDVKVEVLDPMDTSDAEASSGKESEEGGAQSESQRSMSPLPKRRHRRGTRSSRSRHKRRRNRHRGPDDKPEAGGAESPEPKLRRREGLLPAIDSHMGPVTTQVAPTVSLGSHAFIAPPPLVVSPKIEPGVDNTWRSGPVIPPFAAAVPPVMPPMPSPSSVITNDTPRIVSNANNRIFVEGRAYQVIYIKDEAVIEQNNLPHRISFTGPPRNILINGKPYRLAFGKTQTVDIDGVTHTIRFGAPSRELIVGGHPFRGAFGGPPMIGTINGVKHEFRLLGEPPEVRIDQDPCYELARLMSAYRGTPAAPPPEEKKPLVNNDVSTLLKKLKASGLINGIGAFNPEAKAPAPIPNPIRPIGYGARPTPAPVRIMDTVSARADAVPDSIVDFQPNTLAVRYRQAIDELHAKRTACSHCGISFDDTTSQAYVRHVDTHVQEVLLRRESSKSRSRPWFMSRDDWLEFDEWEEVRKLPASAGRKEASTTSLDSSIAPGTSPLDVIASTNGSNECAVCHERFKEYYDNDEEVWRYQDSVLEADVAVHRYCQEQLATNGDA